jgi:exopolyphosphatase / guanosine-5'-triphosphate,3'-diphosphate pyrophosphatase
MTRVSPGPLFWPRAPWADFMPRAFSELPPGSSRRAVIDVGSNSVKLLVGEVSTQGTVAAVWETARQTRLGAGLHPGGRLAFKAIQHTAECVAEFAKEAQAQGAAQVGVVATSAVREAGNQAELLAAVREQAGLAVNVLTGDQEALWMYQGVASDPVLAGSPLLIADAGGGSTEVVLGEGHAVQFHASFGLGTVRMLERFAPEDPPSLVDWQGCRDHVRQVVDRELGPGLGPRLAAWGSRAWRMVGASGTATILARMVTRLDSYDRGCLEGTVLRREGLEALRKEVWSLPLVQRRRLPGLPPERADVILMGVAIYEGLMAWCGAESLLISLRGLRYGALVMLGGSADPGLACSRARTEAGY